MKKINKYILLFIIFLAFVLRFYRLSKYPALNADEAAIGYNAYSLIQTGKDEHGNPWPIHFQSFNDYKPGLYFYLVLPFVRILGLNEWAVRIPSALLGVATVYVLYLLVAELFKEKKLSINHQTLAIVASLLLAISPWHIHFSRGGWEVNVATFFITAGVWLFIKSLNNPKYFTFCALSFAFSLYTYHAARIVVPLLGVGLLVIYRKEVRKYLRQVLVAGLIGGLLLIPLAIDLTQGDVFSRAAGVGLLADPGPLNRINEQRGEHQDFKSLPAVLFHNKPVNYSLAFLENWAEHFWGEFLFLSGDEIQRNRVPETGQMYLLDIIFLIAGLIAIAENLRGWTPVLLWLVAAPTAAALTFQSPHALRAHNMVIPLVIISSFGLLSLVGWINRIIKTKKLLIAFRLSLAILIIWQFVRYEHMYWVHMAKEYPFSSQYGVKELVSYVQQEGDKYEKIVVTDRYDQPYILFLFYLKYPSEKFQSGHQLNPRDKFGFSTVPSFDKYQFEGIEFDLTRTTYPRSLIVGTNDDIPDEANIVKRIYFPSGEIAFKVVAN